MTIPTVQSHEVKSKNPGYGVCTLQSEKTLGPKLLALSSGVLYTEYEYTLLDPICLFLPEDFDSPPPADGG